MQLTFEAETPAAALGEEPSEIIVFQHAGGERADWTDGKVQKEGTHPVVYPAAGSHATFYDSAVYVAERPERLRRRLRQHHRAAARTAAAAGAAARSGAAEQGPFKWLSYDGRWGEKEKGFNNGPTGPTTKTVWSEPFSLDGGPALDQPAPARRHRWSADRRSAPSAAPSPSVSELINLDAKSHFAALATIVVAVLLARPLRRSHQAGARSTSSTCSGAAPSASWSAPRASSTGATGWSWSRSG